MSFNAGPTLMPLTAGLSPGCPARPPRGRAPARARWWSLLGLHDAGALGGPKLDDLFNVWVYTAIELLVCALVLTRAVSIRQDRGAWLALAVGIACYTAGDIYYTLFLENAASVPSPSPATRATCSSTRFAYAALARLVGAHVRDVHANVWLDGAIGGLTLAARRLGARARAGDPIATHGDHGARWRPTSPTRSATCC